jgi:hypothetical protein
MRKIMLLIPFLLALSAPSFAIFHLGLDAGYSYSSMADLNRSWEKAKYDSENNTTTPTAASLSKYGNAVFANIDLSFGDSISFGPRVGIQYVFPAKYSGLKEVVPGLFIPIDTSTDALLIPIMMGVSVGMNPKLPFIITGSAYCGWGIGYAFENTKYAGIGPYMTAYNGGGFMADLSASMEFKLLEFLSLSLNTGYRWASITGMKVVKGVNVNVPGYGQVNINTDNPLTSASGQELAVDFSGINVGLGVNLGF